MKKITIPLLILCALGKAWASPTNSCSVLPQQSGYESAAILHIWPSHRLNISMQYPDGSIYKYEFITDQYGGVMYCVLKQDFNVNNPVVTVIVTDQQSGETYYNGEINYLNGVATCTANSNAPSGMSCNDVD